MYRADTHRKRSLNNYQSSYGNRVPARECQLRAFHYQTVIQNHEIRFSCRHLISLHRMYLSTHKEDRTDLI